METGVTVKGQDIQHIREMVYATAGEPMVQPGPPLGITTEPPLGIADPGPGWKDPRPEADHLFSSAFVDLPAHLKSLARENRRNFQTSDVDRAWTEGEWKMPMFAPVSYTHLTLPTTPYV